MLAEEAAMRREGRGMRRMEDQMLVPIDERRLLLGMAAPEQEHHVIAVFVDDLDGPVGETFPALIAVSPRIALLDGEHARVGRRHECDRGVSVRLDERPERGHDE